MNSGLNDLGRHTVTGGENRKTKPWLPAACVVYAEQRLPEMQMVNAGLRTFFWWCCFLSLCFWVFFVGVCLCYLMNNWMT